MPSHCGQWMTCEHDSLSPYDDIHYVKPYPMCFMFLIFSNFFLSRDLQKRQEEGRFVDLLFSRASGRGKERTEFPESREILTRSSDEGNRSTN